jgi:hypothetical protein
VKNVPCRAADVNGLIYVFAFELKVRVAAQMREIRFFTGNEIV